MRARGAKIGTRRAVPSRAGTWAGVPVSHSYASGYPGKVGRTRPVELIFVEMIVTG